MQLGSNRLLFYAVIVSAALHAMGFVLTGHLLKLTGKPAAPEPVDEFIVTEVLLPAENTNRPKAMQQAPAPQPAPAADPVACLLYTSDAADDSLRVDLGGRRIIKKIF